ncbi:MAG: peroxidase, partial [bacterium]
SALVQDVTAAPVEDQLKPILLHVRKLTLSPAKMTPEDAEAVYAAGWDERALHDAVAICALFNLMNRLVDGLGIDAGDEYFRLASERLATAGYAGLTQLLKAQR